MAHDIFISYSTRDKLAADTVCAILEQAKIRCWIAPRDILPGTPWAAAITVALEQAKALVLVYSANSNKSVQVMRELDVALDLGKPIVPFRIEDVDPSQSMRYYLAGTHWLDALTPPLEAHVQQLADTIRRLTGMEPPQVEPPPINPQPESSESPTTPPLQVQTEPPVERHPEVFLGQPSDKPPLFERVPRIVVGQLNLSALWLLLFLPLLAGGIWGASALSGRNDRPQTLVMPATATATEVVVIVTDTVPPPTSTETRLAATASWTPPLPTETRTEPSATASRTSTATALVTHTPSATRTTRQHTPSPTQENTATPTIKATLSPTLSPATATPTRISPTKTLVPPTSTPVPPTNTPRPQPTNTPVPPTNTPVPPTNTPVPPTDTPVPPTNTPVPPTDTPVPPTDTPIPTVKPTPTDVPTVKPTPSG